MNQPESSKTNQERPPALAGAPGWAGLAELKRQLESIGHKARGGNYRRHRRDSILEDATAAGLRSLAELESELERIAREARPNVVFSDAANVQKP